MATPLIALVGLDAVRGLDLTGPIDALAGAHELVERTGRDDRGYRVVAPAPQAGAGP